MEVGYLPETPLRSMALDPTYPVTHHFKTLSIISVVVLDMNHTHNHLDDFLVTMEQDGVLGQLDDILQEKYCSSTSLNVCLGFFPCRDCTWVAGKQCFGTGSTLQEQFDRLDGHRWDKLVRQKMPHSNGRGILATAHNIEERFSWGIVQRELNRQTLEERCSPRVEMTRVLKTLRIDVLEIPHRRSNCCLECRAPQPECGSEDRRCWCQGRHSCSLESYSFLENLRTGQTLIGISCARDRQLSVDVEQ
ncbi:uncharacterized protein B0H18DRAFT_1103356 [Fomitopsis serialis]|uniref:uncharacterized protein n=1 Tax=Fomitopsis serialis TaxID=139415 RepID=UPI0020073E4C|nr:uncharacterized protein B0H18DRAFT_1103356 [Neoantrodia serialis]KAH9929772.1 hypothetical protein B0H18DRAFT_1103356 [Neoantrodia serialis]